MLWWASYSHYLASPQWAEIKLQALAQDDWRCRSCGAGHRLQGHHVRYPARWALDSPDNVIALCEDCHDAAHGPVSYTWRVVLLAVACAVALWLAWNGS